MPGHVFVVCGTIRWLVCDSWRMLRDRRVGNSRYLPSHLAHFKSRSAQLERP